MASFARSRRCDVLGQFAGDARECSVMASRAAACYAGVIELGAAERGERFVARVAFGVRGNVVGWLGRDDAFEHTGLVACGAAGTKHDIAVNLGTGKTRCGLVAGFACDVRWNVVGRLSGCFLAVVAGRASALDARVIEARTLPGEHAFVTRRARS